MAARTPQYFVGAFMKLWAHDMTIDGRAVTWTGGVMDFYLLMAKIIFFNIITLGIYSFGGWSDRAIQKFMDESLRVDGIDDLVLFRALPHTFMIMLYVFLASLIIPIPWVGKAFVHAWVKRIRIGGRSVKTTFTPGDACGVCLKFSGWQIITAGIDLIVCGNGVRAFGSAFDGSLQYV